MIPLHRVIRSPTNRSAWRNYIKNRFNPTENIAETITVISPHTP